MKTLFTLISFAFFVIQINAQTVISGTVKGDDGSLLSGANVYVRTEKIGAISDENGNFNLSLPNKELIIEFSYLGYFNREILWSPDNGSYLGVVMLISKSEMLDLLTIKASRLEETDPFSKSVMSEEDVKKRNIGKDIPDLVKFTPSVTSTSDNGTGIGYTGLRVRGTDPTRVNVTLNGVPYNDSESQGTFWVDIPDFASSTNNIQIQRGVGNSLNGPSSFGASINLTSLENDEDGSIELFGGLGSFNTHRQYVKFNTGLINNHFGLSGRLSNIQSDGFIDRASSDLKSYYLDAFFKKNKTQINLIHFSGKERTYQSWYGTPEVKLNNDAEGIATHIINNGLSEAQAENLINSDRTYNFYTYPDQVDDYKQDHVQLHWNQDLNTEMKTSLILHYTKGQGFFEQFREQDDFSDYGLEAPEVNGQVIETADLVRRRWLDNDFFGAIWNMEIIPSNKFKIVTGAAYNEYYGDHFGEIIFSSLALNFDKDFRYYDNEGIKKDFNAFVKTNIQLNDNLNLYADIQYRNVNYTVQGVDNDLRNLEIDENFGFVNPKLGLNYDINELSSAYASVAVANREPNRSNFIDALADQNPTHETLYDFEAGYRFNRSNFGIELNAYYMLYNNQLILTGALNDVGNPIQQNVDDSYRMGLELSWEWNPIANLNWNANLTISRNRIKEFNEIIYDYTNGFEVIENQFTDTDIAFSPNYISSSLLTYKVFRNFSLEWATKYVHDQFLDNTSNEARKIDSYLINEMTGRFTLDLKNGSALEAFVAVHNLFDVEYETNGYTFSYIFGDLITENFLYPQAGRHWMSGVLLRF